jgi:hypothetical protein
MSLSCLPDLKWSRLGAKDFCPLLVVLSLGAYISSSYPYFTIEDYTFLIFNRMDVYFDQFEFSLHFFLPLLGLRFPVAAVCLLPEPPKYQILSFVHL